METTSTTFQFADHLLGGTLVDQLRAWRESDMSFEGMAKELFIMTDRKINVSGPTVNNWYHEHAAA